MKSLFESCNAFLKAQADRITRDRNTPPLAITLSRQMGAGALTISGHLAEYLQPRLPDSSIPWAVFEQNVIAKVLEEHLLPDHLEQYMPEDSTPLLSGSFEELLGLHPEASTLVQKTAETIFSLASHGNVILIGRGSNIVTAQLQHVLHVRLVAPIEKRINNIQDDYELERSSAEKLIAETDEARRRYVRQNFDSAIDDPLAYHLTLNTGRLSYEAAARLIGEAALTLCKLPQLAAAAERTMTALSIEP